MRNPLPPEVSYLLRNLALPIGLILFVWKRHD